MERLVLYSEDGLSMADVAIKLSQMATGVLFYRKWSEQTDFDLLLSYLRESVRIKRGQNRQTGVA